MSKDIFKFSLKSGLPKTQINIDDKNTFITLDKIYCQCPNYKHRDLTINLKQKFMNAFFAISNLASMANKSDIDSAVEEKDDSKLDDKIIKMIFYNAKDFNLSGYYQEFTKLLKKVCFKDEDCKQSLNNLDFEKLIEDDFEGLIIAYIENFFITSWMNALK